jgi:hypothetical protein
MPSGNPPASPPPDGLAGHPDLDTLADLDAGLLDSPLAARAGQHATACPRCSAVLAGLAAVRVDLRSLPPLVLPPAVVARLDATVAALRAGQPATRLPPIEAVNSHRPHSPGLGGPAPPATPVNAAPVPGADAPVVDLAAAAEQRRARGRRLLSRVAASVVVLAAMVGVGTAVLQHADDNATVQQGSALPEDRAEGSAAGGGAAAPQVGNDARPSFSAPPGAGPAYTEDTLLSAIPLIVARSAVDIVTNAGPNGPAGPMADTQRRARCTAGIPSAAGALVAVQRVLFDNRSAYVFVFADPDGSRTVIVVAADCGASAASQVLFRHHG